MSFPQTTPVRPVPGAFLNTPAVASKFQSAADPTRRQLFPVSESNQPASRPAAPNRSGSESGALMGPVSRNEVSTTSGNGNLPLQNAFLAPRSENVPPVTKAAKAINAFLQQDESFPDLDSCCRRKNLKTKPGVSCT